MSETKAGELAARLDALGDAMREAMYADEWRPSVEAEPTFELAKKAAAALRKAAIAVPAGPDASEALERGSVFRHNGKAWRAFSFAVSSDGSLLMLSAPEEATHG